MKIESSTYVPILKWRMGEYQALFRLASEVKNNITPLILIPPIEYDFEARRMKHTVSEHLSTFAPRFSAKWGERRAMIDFHSSLDEERLDDGSSPVEHLFRSLESLELPINPVSGLRRTKAYSASVRSIVRRYKRGISIRISLEDLMKADLNVRLLEFCSYLKVGMSDVDLIVDFGCHEEYEPYEQFANAVYKRLGKIEQVKDIRSLALCSTSLKLSNIAKPGDEVPRHEWLFYRALLNIDKDELLPSFGDYSIETPDFTNMDMRMIKPSGKIVYSSDNSWFITKGKAFRGNEDQMISHCKRIIKSGHYSGEKFSDGDKRIFETAYGKNNCGNLSTWKQAGMNHHFTKVVDQLSNLHGK